MGKKKAGFIFVGSLIANICRSFLWGISVSTEEDPLSLIWRSIILTIICHWVEGEGEIHHPKCRLYLTPVCPSATLVHPPLCLRPTSGTLCPYEPTGHNGWYIPLSSLPKGVHGEPALSSLLPTPHYHQNCSVPF